MKGAQTIYVCPSEECAFTAMGPGKCRSHPYPCRAMGPQLVPLKVEPLPEPEPGLTERGFAIWDPIGTDYGAVVRFGESSSSAEGSKIWMWVDQPLTDDLGALPAAKTAAHLTIEQAEEIRERLGEAIIWAKAKEEGP